MRLLLFDVFTATKTIFSKQEVLNDYKLICESREVSLLGRKDVFMGRAKFGIFGDGKELPQIALSKVFRKGDFRSGYYRDQTLLAAMNLLTWQQFFAQLYAHANPQEDVHSGGRTMNGHYCNHWIDDQGQWLKQTEMLNSIMDVSSTAGQMPRALGVAYASKLFRNLDSLKSYEGFSRYGNEICFANIGDASTSQGMFFETINAAGVLQIPLVFSVWDDGYGISVPQQLQTTKSSISEALAGFGNEHGLGIEIIKVNGWDYPALIDAYQKAALLARDQHIPVLVHVTELTQPQGHSASGSHERYKSKDRLAWEHEHDCNRRFKEWILLQELGTEVELEQIEKEAIEHAKNARKNAWDCLRHEVNAENKEVLQLVLKVENKNTDPAQIEVFRKSFENINTLHKKDGIRYLKKMLRIVTDDTLKSEISNLCEQLISKNKKRYNTHLYSEYTSSPMQVKPIEAQYDENAPIVDGREIINRFFDQLFKNNPLVFALGEDVGNIGDVNQGFAGLQEKYGEMRITDTGIREATIIGQGIGMAMRGLRPIAEIQYFDYIYYALATMTDDLASLRYRSMGKQLAPLIIRTRGHRLEGIWHSGSPMSVMIHALRGMHILCPRNFVKAAGFYNTLLKGDDPALMIECLNGYRHKEKLPNNLHEICEPLGVPETIKTGTDITLVTYGSMCRIVMEAATDLEKVGISVEVIDVQTLVPFDINANILESIKRTHRVIFADEDMPGGGSAYMMQHVLDGQNAYHYLDAKPVAISAEPHRPAYSNDGDYFSKPNAEIIFDAAYNLMHEAKPLIFKELN